jgi:hypothetical protein
MSSEYIILQSRDAIVINVNIHFFREIATKIVHCCYTSNGNIIFAEV